MKILHLSDIHFGRNYARTKIKDPFEKRDEYDEAKTWFLRLLMN